METTAHPLGAEPGLSEAAKQIGALLDESPEAPPEETTPAEAHPEAEPAADEAQDADPSEDTSDTQDAPVEPDEDQTIDPPVSWSDEEKAEFATLPPDVQSVVARRESEREAAFQGKSTQLAEQRREFDEAVATVTQIQQQNLAQATGLLQVLVQEHLGAQPNWDELRATDPDEYLLQRETFREREGRLQQIQQVVAQNLQKAQGDQARKLNEFRAKQAELLVQRRPELADAEKGHAWGTKLRGYLEGQGFNQTELKGLMDVRQIDLAEKAMKYDEIQAQKPNARDAVRKAAPKVAKPGNQNAPRQTKGQAGYVKARQNLARNPKSNDAAAAAIGALLNLSEGPSARR